MSSSLTCGRFLEHTGQSGFLKAEGSRVGSPLGTPLALPALGVSGRASVSNRATCTAASAPSALFLAALLLATSSIECRFCAACAPQMGHVALCPCEPGGRLCWAEQLGRAPSQNLEDGLPGSRLWVAPSHRSLALSCLTGSREKLQPPQAQCVPWTLLPDPFSFSQHLVVCTLGDLLSDCF